MTEAAKTVSSRGRVAWLLAAACLLASPAAAQSLEPAVVVTGDWPPYVEESAPGGGIFAELLSAALAGMGRQAEYRFVLFDQAFDLAGREGVAGTFPWFRTAQRDETWVYGEEELFDVEYVLFVRRQALAAAGLDSDAVDSVADLDSLRFGGVSGYAYSPAVARRIRPQRRYPTDNAAFEALLEAQIDVVQSDFRTGMHLITGPLADRRQQVVVLAGGELTYRQPVYFIAAADHPGAEAFVAALDEELRRLELAGFFDHLLDRTDRDSRWVVRLAGNDSFPLVVGHRGRDDDEAILIPNGTRAVVFEWAERFQQPGPVRVHRDMFVKSRVRLLDGPRRGDTVWVQSLYIQLP